MGGGKRYPKPEKLREQFAFCDRGLPRGGLWVSPGDLAGCFGVSQEAVRRWRQDPTFPVDEAVAEVDGRPVFNVVRVLFWRIDKARRGGDVPVNEAVARVGNEFRGVPEGRGIYA